MKPLRTRDPFRVHACCLPLIDTMPITSSLIQVRASGRASREGRTESVSVWCWRLRQRSPPSGGGVAPFLLPLLLSSEPSNSAPLRDFLGWGQYLALSETRPACFIAQSCGRSEDVFANLGCKKTPPTAKHSYINSPLECNTTGEGRGAEHLYRKAFTVHVENRLILSPWIHTKRQRRALIRCSFTWTVGLI